ncbi:MAG: alpha/beta hydrolase [Pseudomonadota bacterium]
MAALKGDISVDGAVLEAFAWGDPRHPPVLIINGLGQSEMLIGGAARHLSRRFYVVTWNSRNILSSHDFSAESADFSVDRQVLDAECVADAFGLQDPVLIGYSTGALVAAKASLSSRFAAPLAILCNGHYAFGEEVAETPFQRDMRAVMPKIAATPSAAKFFARSIFNHNGIVDNAGGDFYDIVVQPMRDPTSLQRYAYYFNGFLQEDFASWAGRVATSCQMFAGAVDTVSHLAHSEKANELLRRSTLRIQPDGDHYMMCRDGSPMLQEIEATLQTLFAVESS